MEKIYYTIGDVAEILGESVTLVRYWTSVFCDTIRPVRNKKGNRLYTAPDVANFKIIYHLVKEQGMTLDGAKKRLRENKDGEDRTVDIIASLNRIKSDLLEIKELL